jgi:D-alanyl-D-alanine dipeptidase
MWDAYRDRAVHLAVFDACLVGMGYASASPDEAREFLRSIIGDPEDVFGYGTGGAVDVTLLLDNQEADMGTDFYDFVPESNPDWYRLYSPANQRATEAAANRSLLRSAMEHAGFIVSNKVWWHFE